MADKEKTAEEEPKKEASANIQEEEKYQGGPIPRVAPPKETKE